MREAWWKVAILMVSTLRELVCKSVHAFDSNMVNFVCQQVSLTIMQSRLSLSFHWSNSKSATQSIWLSICKLAIPVLLQLFC